MNPFAKQAKPYVAGIAPEVAEHNNELKAEALRRALRAGLLGLGGGLALSGALGLPQLLKKPSVPSYPLQTEVELPYPQPLRKKADSAALDIGATPLINAAWEARRSKHHDAADPTQSRLYAGARGVMSGAAGAAGGILGQSVGMPLLRSRHLAPHVNKLPADARWLLPLAMSLPAGLLAQHFANPAVDHLSEKMMGPKPSKTDKPVTKKADLANTAVHALGLATQPGQQTPVVGSPGWVRGDSMQSVGSIPWALPAAAGAGLGGLFGGHAIVRHLLHQKHKRDLEAELSAAQKEYEEAMLSQYDPAKLRQLGGHKEAGATTVLDACFDMLEKRAFMGLPSFNALAGHGAGAYLTGAGLLGVGTGIGTYQWLQGRSKYKTLKDALKRRAMLRSLANPTDLYVRPVPVEYEDDKTKAKGKD